MTALVWVLTALAALVVVLTRLRLSGDESGRFAVSDRLLAAHTLTGVAALVMWVTFLIAPDDTFVGGSLFGVLALAMWWAVVVCGLLLLMRWLPSGGRHVPQDVGDAWGKGPGLSMLAHLGMAAGVLVFTWAYAVAAV